MWLKPEYNSDGLPDAASLIELFEKVAGLIKSGKAVSCYTPGMGGVAEAVFKMCIGNGLRLSISTTSSPLTKFSV